MSQSSIITISENTEPTPIIYSTDNIQSTAKLSDKIKNNDIQ